MKVHQINLVGYIIVLIYFDKSVKAIELDNNRDLDVFLDDQKENDTSSIFKDNSFKKL